MNTVRIFRAMTACVALATAFGCQPEQPNPYTEALGSGDGREVAALADGPVSVRQQDDYFSVKLSGHLVIIQKDRLLVDAEERGQFPAGSSRFHVTFTNSTLRVMANGVEVLQTPLAAPSRTTTPAKKK